MEEEENRLKTKRGKPTGRVRYNEIDGLWTGKAERESEEKY